MSEKNFTITLPFSVLCEVYDAMLQCVEEYGDDLSNFRAFIVACNAAGLTANELYHQELKSM